MSKVRYAVDLGTTTVDCRLYDEKNNKTISEYSFKNPQSLYGRDVITRINATIRNEQNLYKLRELITDGLDAALKTMLDNSGVDSKDVYKTVICGNTTMVSIVLGMDISPLGAYPFTPGISDCIECTAMDIGLSTPEPDSYVLISGCASAFIGGDILSGLYYLDNKYDLLKHRSRFMLLDLGTNGEIVVSNGQKLYACSTACGPAFENCTRRQNVYGSSTIDALAMCLVTGKLKKEGNLSDEYIDGGIDIMGIHLDMDIIHQILLAKAAIRTGIDSLLEYAGIKQGELDAVYMAGGFGFYLNVDNAIRLGLLPSSFGGRINIVGNTSLLGGCTALKDDINYYTDRIEVVQFALNDDYQEKLINNMIFGE